MSTKNIGKFGLAYQVLNDEGKPVGVRARITDDIILKRGQTIFFNDFKEDLRGLVGKVADVSSADIEARISAQEARDAEYGQETLYSLRAGKIQENNGLTGKAPGSKL